MQIKVEERMKKLREKKLAKEEAEKAKREIKRKSAMLMALGNKLLTSTI